MKLHRTAQAAFVVVFMVLTFNIVSTRYFKVKPYKPVVLIPGFLADNNEMSYLNGYITKTHPGTKVIVINAYNSGRSVVPMWYQIKKYAKIVRNISLTYPEGLHIIGYSQGGLIARGVLELLPNHNVDTFVSLATPQMGMYGVPATPDVIGNYLKKSIHWLSYSSIGQHFSVGGYWRDPNNLEEYKNSSEFLPFLNNEVKHEKQEDFKRNFASVGKVILLCGPDDGVIKPWISGLFGFVDVNGTKVDIMHQEIFLNDSFGLQSIHNRNALHLFAVPGIDHFHWYKNYTIYETYIEQWLT